MNANAASSLRIFLVDESRPVRQRIALLLRATEGVAVVGEADDLDSALNGIAVSSPDVVVLDLRLAGGSGLDLLASLVHEPGHVVTIVLTNYAGPSFREASMRAGADYFFDKTTEFHLALESIGGLARRSPINTVRVKE